ARAGQAGGAAPGGVAEPAADVIDTEIDHTPAGIADGPGEHAPVKQAIQERENPGGLVVGGQLALGKPDPQCLGGHVADRRELAAYRRDELPERPGPADHHRTERRAGVIQWEPGPGAVAPSPRDPPAVPAPRPPPPPPPPP